MSSWMAAGQGDFWWLLPEVVSRTGAQKRVGIEGGMC